MELMTYLTFLLKYWWWMVIGLLVGGGIAAAIAYTAADEYQASVSIYVQRAPDPVSENYFTYEGYYAQQTAAAYADTALELLTNDEIVKRAASFAGLSADVGAVSRLKGSITTKKDAPQLLKVDVIRPTKKEAADFVTGLSQSLKTRTSEINRAGGDSKLSVEQINDIPFVVLVRPLWWLYALVGAVLGLIGTTLAAALWAYATQQRR